MSNERPLDNPVAYSSVSRDGGKTWSEAKPEANLPNYRAKSFFGKDQHSTYIYVYNDSAERRALKYKLRHRDGDWSVERLFYFANDRNSYPTLIEDSPGTWLAVWDSSTGPDRKRTAIRFGRLETGE